MNSGEHYRLNTPTLAIYSNGGNNRIPLLIPSGALVTLEGLPPNGERFVDVVWDGRAVVMFTLDLQQRGTKMD